MKAKERELVILGVLLVKELEGRPVFYLKETGITQPKLLKEVRSNIRSSIIRGWGLQLDCWSPRVDDCLFGWVARLNTGINNNDDEMSPTCSESARPNICARPQT